MSSTEIITLAPITLTRAEFFSLLMRLRVRGQLWLYAMMMMLGLLILIAFHHRQLMLLLGLVHLTYPLLIAGLVYRHTRLASNRGVHEERRYELHPTGMKWRMAGGADGNLPWSYVTRWVELAEYHVLYVGPSSFIFLRKSAFPMGDAEDKFRGWLSEVKKG